MQLIFKNPRTNKSLESQCAPQKLLDENIAGGNAKQKQTDRRSLNN